MVIITGAVALCTYYVYDATRGLVAGAEKGREARGGPAPLLVTSQVGRGRVLYQAFADLWRMRFPSELGPDALERLHGHVVQYLGLAKLLGRTARVEINTDKEEYAVGDRVIERVAMLLREQVRSDDLLAQERVGPRSEELHARFGGDEFCFLIPDIAECHQAHAVGERFREAVERYDWTLEDQRLAVQPVRVDVGVVCFWLGRVADRRFIARRLSADLIRRADELMYEAKSERANHIYLMRAVLERGALVDWLDADPETVEDDRT